MDAYRAVLEAIIINVRRTIIGIVPIYDIYRDQCEEQIAAMHEEVDGMFAARTAGPIEYELSNQLCELSVLLWNAYVGYSRIDSKRIVAICDEIVP